VPSNGITSILHFMKIGQLVQKFKGEGEKTDSVVISLDFFRSLRKEGKKVKVKLSLCLTN
jgi:hypothetical protein